MSVCNTILAPIQIHVCQFPTPNSVCRSTHASVCSSIHTSLCPTILCVPSFICLSGLPFYLLLHPYVSLPFIHVFLSYNFLCSFINMSVCPSILSAPSSIYLFAQPSCLFLHPYVCLPFYLHPTL